MELLAGFYIVMGLLIIVLKSGFLANWVYKPLFRLFGREKTSTGKSDNYYTSSPKRVALQKVPVYSKSLSRISG